MDFIHYTIPNNVEFWPMTEIHGGFGGRGGEQTTDDTTMMMARNYYYYYYYYYCIIHNNQIGREDNDNGQ
jgi:hypothetical protein